MRPHRAAAWRQSHAKNVSTLQTPITDDGRTVPGLEDVGALDGTDLILKQYQPSVTVESKVHRGRTESGKCGTDQPSELVKGTYGNRVVYCLEVTNTGDTSLDDILLFSPDADFETTLETLAPGESKMVPVQSRILQSSTNLANVTAVSRLALNRTMVSRTSRKFSYQLLSLRPDPCSIRRGDYPLPGSRYAHRHFGSSNGRS